MPSAISCGFPIVQLDVALPTLHIWSSIFPGSGHPENVHVINRYMAGNERAGLSGSNIIYSLQKIFCATFSFLGNYICKIDICMYIDL